MRIYTSKAHPVDLCRGCARGLTEDTAFQRWGHLGDVDDDDDRGNGFAFDAPHPDYDDVIGEYQCHDCGRELTERD